ncbi:MAG: glycine zipper 2TM domain-containing protein [Alphaproteobacteria bacterium]|nr:glycine zipper 2TM domain-containing protein [Alphaproteobacteria bacterium]OJV17119.1 MAG: hypothetical protein BGO27_06030 [Alphaproteobacteria bacterium 33-17]
MVKKITSLALIACISASLLASCKSGPNGEIMVSRRDTATLIGAVGAGILGSKVGKGNGRIAGAAVGALVGAGFGSWMGENLDNRSRNYHYKTTQSTLESAPIGETHEWANPDSNTHGYVTPTRTYKKNDRYCREYTQQIVVGGRTQEAVGRACRNADGTWQVIE